MQHIIRKPFLFSAIAFCLLLRAQAVDLTFFTCSDTHYLQWASSNLNRTAIVDMMNALPGKTYPDGVGGGVVATPRGVIVPGDLIDHGQGPKALIKQEWAMWTTDFGLKNEGRIKFPVYEGYGNHDLNSNLLVENEIKARTLARSDVVAISSNGFHYAWEWEGIHFIQLNLYPADERPKGVKGQPPRYALQFLKDSLQKNVGGSRKPVVVVHHYMPTDGWWTEEEKKTYLDVIKEYNVILITHGHQGRASITEWNGFTVLNNHYFLTAGAFAVRIYKDEQTEEHHLTVAQCLPSGKWGPLTFKKKIDFPKAK
jgi:cytolysin (calcineurin-like family phosphatase)